MGFAVWLMWSVTIAKIQAAHNNDPNVYYFKDFAPDILGTSEGFRGCPGWYESKCCLTWKDAPAAHFHQWLVKRAGRSGRWRKAQLRRASVTVTQGVPQTKCGKGRRSLSPAW